MKITKVPCYCSMSSVLCNLPMQKYNYSFYMYKSYDSLSLQIIDNFIVWHMLNQDQHITLQWCIRMPVLLTAPRVWYANNNLFWRLFYISFYIYVISVIITYAATRATHWCTFVVNVTIVPYDAIYSLLSSCLYQTNIFWQKRN